MDDTLKLKLELVFTDESDEKLKEHIQKLIHEAVKEEMKKYIPVAIPYYPVYPYPQYSISPIYTTNQPPIQDYVTITCDCIA
jgi:hypothetical protein